MKIIEPKTKTGRPILGVTITHHPDNTVNRWYINGEKVTLEKIAKLLGYASKSQLHLYIAYQKSLVQSQILIALVL